MARPGGGGKGRKSCVTTLSLSFLSARVVVDAAEKALRRQQLRDARRMRSMRHVCPSPVVPSFCRFCLCCPCRPLSFRFSIFRPSSAIPSRWQRRWLTLRDRPWLGRPLLWLVDGASCFGSSRRALPSSLCFLLSLARFLFRTRARAHTDALFPSRSLCAAGLTSRSSLLTGCHEGSSSRSASASSCGASGTSRSGSAPVSAPATRSNHDMGARCKGGASAARQERGEREGEEEKGWTLRRTRRQVQPARRVFASSPSRKALRKADA